MMGSQAGNSRELHVDFARDVVSFLLMVVAILVIIGLLAALFMIIFSIATGVDEHLQE
jgi:flagellar biosynthesis protein FliQ